VKYLNDVVIIPSNLKTVTITLQYITHCNTMLVLQQYQPALRFISYVTYRAIYIK